MIDSVIQERNKEIMQTYYLIISRYDIAHVPMKLVLSLLSNSPASRFYMSEDRAARYIAEYERGQLSLKGPKLVMFNDFYRVYQRQSERLKGYYKSYIVSYSLHQQAPSFYLSPYQIKRIIFSQQK